MMIHAMVERVMIHAMMERVMIRAMVESEMRRSCSFMYTQKDIHTKKRVREILIWFL